MQDKRDALINTSLCVGAINGSGGSINISHGIGRCVCAGIHVGGCNGYSHMQTLVLAVISYDVILCHGAFVAVVW